MLKTTLSTLVNDEQRFLAPCKKEELLGSGGCNVQNIGLVAAASYLTIYRPSWAPTGTIQVHIKGLGKAKSEQCLVPSNGEAREGWGMVTAALNTKDNPETRNRLWIPVAVEGGWHFQYFLAPTLFLGIKADGHPTLSTTPVVWQMGTVDLTVL